MEDRIEELELRVHMLETMFDNQWRLLLDDMVREYIHKNYPYCGSGDSGLYDRVLEEMKDKIRRILMED